MTTRTTNIYFLQSEHGGPIKIGKSQNIERRTTEIQSHSPFRLKLIHKLENVAFDFEAFLHKNLKRYRLHGEWFSGDVYNKIMRLSENNIEEFCKKEYARERDVMKSKKRICNKKIVCSEQMGSDGFPKPKLTQKDLSDFKDFFIQIIFRTNCTMIDLSHAIGIWPDVLNRVMNNMNPYVPEVIYTLVSTYKQGWEKDPYKFHVQSKKKSKTTNTKILENLIA